MGNSAAIQQEIRWARQRNAAAQAEIDSARAQIWACEEKIAQLQRELAGLEDFRTRTTNDLSQLQSQADERKAAYASLESIPNVTAFIALSAKMRSTIDGTTKRGIQDAGDDILRQINRAAGDIQHEIDELRARIASLEQIVRNNQAAIHQNNNSISRLYAQLDAEG